MDWKEIKVLIENRINEMLDNVFFKTWIGYFFIAGGLIIWIKAWWLFGLIQVLLGATIIWKHTVIVEEDEGESDEES